jgi:5-methylcytosine-specific restriction endonuclease McrA
MEQYSIKINESRTQCAADSLSKNTSTGNTSQLVDNRVTTSTLKNSNVLVKQLKSNESISNFNSNVVQLVNGITFTKQQRQKKLAANKKKNGGFYTCTHCGFQHKKTQYATFKGRRMGDGNFQIDHIVHASKGGRNSMRNGRVLCGTCNTSRGNRATVGRTGMQKYHALHQKRDPKDYLRKPNKN